MTARTRRPVEPAAVRYRDEALVALATHLARSTDGVAHLQPTLTGRVAATARAGVGRVRGHGDTTARVADGGAVTVGDTPDGLEVGVRLVTHLNPSPARTVDQVGRAIARELGALTGRPVVVEVTIVDVVD